MKAVLLVSHGSRSPKTKQEVLGLVKSVGRSLPGVSVHFAFLEIASPSIPEGIDQCAAKGAKQIIVALNFLNSGRHVNDDIPAIVRAAQKKYPHIKLSITKPIGQHAEIPKLFSQLVRQK